MSQPKGNSGFTKIKTEWLKFMLEHCKDEMRIAKNSNNDWLLFMPFHHITPQFVDYILLFDDKTINDFITGKCAVDDTGIDNNDAKIKFNKKIAYYSAQGILCVPTKYTAHYYKIVVKLNKQAFTFENVSNYLTIEKSAYIFTDGASDVKSTPRKAGWAFYYSIGNKNIINYGPLQQQEDDNGQPIEKTNNQAEGIAIIKAIQFLIRNNINCEVTLVTDSNLYINIIKSYMHNWHDQDPNFNCNTSSGTPIKNVKIIRELYHVYMQYTQNNELNIIHVNSHRKAPSDIHSQEYKLWHGNSIADKYASEGRITYEEKELRLDKKITTKFEDFLVE